MLSQLADYKVPYTPYHSHSPMPVFSHRLVAILMIVALEAFMLAAILWLVAKLVGLLITVEVVLVETYVLASILLVLLVLVESDVVVVVVMVVVEAYVLAAVLDWLLLFRPTNDEAAELHKEIKVTIRWLGDIFFQQVSSGLCTLKILFLGLWCLFDLFLLFIAIITQS